LTSPYPGDQEHIGTLLIRPSLVISLDCCLEGRQGPAAGRCPLHLCCFLPAARPETSADHQLCGILPDSSPGCCLMVFFPFFQPRPLGPICRQRELWDVAATSFLNAIFLRLPSPRHGIWQAVVVVPPCVFSLECGLSQARGRSDSRITPL